MGQGSFRFSSIKKNMEHASNYQVNSMVFKLPEDLWFDNPFSFHRRRLPRKFDTVFKARKNLSFISNKKLIIQYLVLSFIIIV